ncbi:hypothetical protein JCM8097_008780 [Rhodosporidiobolus ruineniae]
MSPTESHIDLPPWVSLDVTHVSVALAVLGFYLVSVGQFSALIKEKLLLSSALVAFCVGIIVGPIGLDWLSPWQWVGFDEDARNSLTFQICRVIIGIQVMFAGIDLPAAYLRREALSLTMLLLPVMVLAWFTSAGFVYVLVKGISFLEALAIAACITPTDPILANAIVKGRFANQNVPKAVRDILSAESGANDGLGYPFLFIAIFLMQRNGKDGSIGAAVQHWVVTTWIYQILVSVVIGAVVGYIARKTLKYAHRRNFINHEEFLAYGVGLALFTLGVVGVLGSDDILACFVAGNSLTWRDFYRIEASEEDTFQDVVDTLLDTSVFIYLGTLVPWSEFTSDYLTPWRLVVLGICILLFRRLPFVLALYKVIPALDGWKQAAFAGWYGPIGVSAIYYAILALHTLPEDRVVLRQVIFPVVMFMAMSSTITHGISIPLSQAAPLAFTRTKTSMSLASKAGFVARCRSLVSTGDVSEAGEGTTSLPKPNGEMSMSEAAFSPAASRAVSARPSMEEPQMVSAAVVQQPLPAVQTGGGGSGTGNAEAGERGRSGSTAARVEFDLP